MTQDELDIYMKFWKQCAFLVITTMELWELVHLDTWCIIKHCWCWYQWTKKVLNKLNKERNILFIYSHYLQLTQFLLLNKKKLIHIDYKIKFNPSMHYVSTHQLKKTNSTLNALCPKMAKTHLRNLAISTTRFSQCVWPRQDIRY